jgi:hypothetical protein
MTPIPTYDEYLQGLLRELEGAKAKHAIGVFRISDRLNKDTPKLLERYFKNSDSYILEIHKCNRCTDKYDVMITFTGR